MSWSRQASGGVGWTIQTTSRQYRKSIGDTRPTIPKFQPPSLIGFGERPSSPALE